MSSAFGVLVSHCLTRCLLLCQVHYNSLYPAEEPPSNEALVGTAKVLGSKQLARLWRAAQGKV